MVPVYYPSDGDYESVEAALKQNNKRSLVIVNHNLPSEILYIPYEWAFKGRVLPQRIQALALGFFVMTLSRPRPNRLLLESPAGFVLDQNAPMREADADSQPILDTVYNHRIIQGLFAPREHDFHVGQTIQRVGMTIKILELNRDAEPTKLQFEFTNQEAIDDKIWQYYDWDDKKFKKMAAPKVGEKRYFPGPFDV